MPNFLSRYGCYEQLIPHLQVSKLMYYFDLLFLCGINKKCCCHKFTAQHVRLNCGSENDRL